ncbi:restriction endonuclease subunit S [Wohlfahrtiimonas chitiniclastica]|uniref:restriction endonuclease subunit S n=1 Tax=Wohlfahrtiimonas chitiniclastica TaxID=400946 RepID=UPI000B999916|nr:restriction endonuclease subunit S [Wohlfahrtiimonas chitiniclastica]MBS7836295.1 restriction endonuclease subunit S [Wohlfahrtiimonas chitiniclastica]OYQ89692.1 hypothetical protein B9T21_02780 [Wohlfahrtiimonas chitiniclastica]
MINNNHELLKVPEGYKQTEVGIIPDDWGKLSIGKNAILHARIGWQALTTAEYMSVGDYFLVTGTDFDAGTVNWDRCCFVSEWRFRQDTKIQLKQDDVLITKDGTIGKIGFVDSLKKQATLNSGIFVIRPKNNVFIPKYLFYVLTSHFFKEFINRITAGSTIVHLYQKDFVEFEFYVPKSLTEQTAIANALSDVDALIAKLEKLIVKKEAIKTGAMQQLLTGRTRLPQFAKREDGTPKGYKDSELGKIPEDWEGVTLGCLSEVRMCKRILSYQTSKAGEIPFYKISTFGGIPDAFISHVLYEEFKRKYSYPSTGDILLSAAGTIGKSVVYDGHKAYFQDSNIVWLDVDKNRLNNNYLYHYYQNIKWASPEGSTISRLYNGIIKSTNIALPLLKEQILIAEILSDMDSEIEALEKRLEKTKALKQGMMQELLTGRTRLV